MRCNPLRWLWGVIPIGLLSWVTVLGEHERIEADLAARVGQELEKTGLNWVGAAFSGRDGAITGRTSEDSEPTKAYDVVRRVWGVRIVENNAQLVDTVEGYVWSASLRDNRVKISGFVPNDETRKTIFGVAQATFPGREIQDLQRLARGNPPLDTWLGGVTFGLKQLAFLRAGSVDLDRTSLSLAGEADDPRAYRSIKSALAGSLPQGVTLKADRVRPPAVSPYVWSAQHNGRQIVMSGYVPSEKTREDLFAAAKKAFPTISVVDRTEIAAGEGRQFEVAVRAVIAILATLEEGIVDLRDAHLTLAGRAATDSVAEDVRRRLRASELAGIRIAEQVKAREQAPAPVSPYVTRVSIESPGVVLSGYAPSEAARAMLTETAALRLPGRRVVDRLEIASGASEGWQACVKAGLSALGRLGGGDINLSDKSMVLTGITDSEDLYAALPVELRTAAGRACETDVRLKLDVPSEPTLTWRAIRQPGEILLEGEVLDHATKIELVSTASKLFVKERVVDRMMVTHASSKKWGKVAELGLKSLVRLRTGEAVISGPHLVVTGEAPDAAVVTAVREAITRGMPRGYFGREAISVRSDAMIWAEEEARRKANDDARRKAEEEARRRSEVDVGARAKQADEARRVTTTAALQAEADRCKAAMSTAIREGVINFERASADLDRRSFTTLRQLARIAASCPGAQIEIEGHTDGEGLPERNQRLSERRAQTVVDYLIKAGVEADRLTAIGYGAARPVAANDTAENRAKNRRIEFEVRLR